jgi:hypothetical protein
MFARHFKKNLIFLLKYAAFRKKALSLNPDGVVKQLQPVTGPAF